MCFDVKLMCCNINNPACCTISLEAFVLQVELLSEVMNDCTIVSMDYISSMRIIEKSSTYFNELQRILSHISDPAYI